MTKKFLLACMVMVITIAAFTSPAEAIYTGENWLRDPYDFPQVDSPYGYLDWGRAETVANVTYKPVLAVWPWGYYQGFCIMVGARWDAGWKHTGPPGGMSRLPTPELWGRMEGVIRAVAMDGYGNCNVNVWIQNVGLLIVPHFRSWDHTQDWHVGPAIGTTSNGGSLWFWGESKEWAPPRDWWTSKAWPGQYSVVGLATWTMPNGQQGSMPFDSRPNAFVR